MYNYLMPPTSDEVCGDEPGAGPAGGLCVQHTPGPRLRRRLQLPGGQRILGQKVLREAAKK